MVKVQLKGSFLFLLARIQVLEKQANGALSSVKGGESETKGAFEKQPGGTGGDVTEGATSLDNHLNSFIFPTLPFYFKNLLLT